MNEMYMHTYIYEYSFIYIITHKHIYMDTYRYYSASSIALYQMAPLQLEMAVYAIHFTCSISHLS